MPQLEECVNIDYGEYGDTDEEGGMPWTSHNTRTSQMAANTKKVEEGIKGKRQLKKARRQKYTEKRSDKDNDKS